MKTKRNLNLSLLLCVVAAATLATFGFAQMIPAHHGGAGSPLGQYIDPAELLMSVGVCSPADSKQQCQDKLVAETRQYFKAIGVYDSIRSDGTGNPSADRGTFSAWKKTLGFSDDRLNPVTDEIRASYFNNGDLQFGRDMHCRIQRKEQQVGALKKLLVATYACYVSNFSNDPPNPGPVFDKNVDPRSSAGLAAGGFLPGGSDLGQHAIATVAMEVTLAPVGGVIKGKPEVTVKFGDVKFLAYNKDGSPFETPALDSEGAKAIPGLCMDCHGGAYVPASQAGGPAVKSGNFLPFDTLNLILTADNLPDAQRPDASDDVFRRLNGFVKQTPVRQTIADLIDGWYAWCGGIGNAKCFIDYRNHPFIPSADCKVGKDENGKDYDQSIQTCGWATGKPLPATSPKTDFPTPTFYTEVVATYCRTCHAALSDHFNVQNYEEFAHDPFHRLPNSVSTQYHMPFAEVPYNLYWLNTPGVSKEGARDFFDTFFTTGVTPRDECLLQVVPSCVADCANDLATCRTRGGGACDITFKACADPCLANDPQSQGIQKYSRHCPPF